MELPIKLKIEQHVLFERPKVKKPTTQPAPKPKAAKKAVVVNKKPITSPLNIILLGDPAAGKATQAQFLIKKYPLYDLDMGKELRILQVRDKKIREAMKKTYDKGHVTQTNIVRKIFQKRIFETPKSKGILFDGNPKQIGEAKLIFQWLKQQKREKAILLYLTIPMQETLKRMANRTEYFKGKFSKRTDDNTTALQNRVKYYRKNIAGVIAFFKTKYPYKQISGLGSRAEVQKKIVEYVKKYQ